MESKVAFTRLPDTNTTNTEPARPCCGCCPPCLGDRKIVVPAITILSGLVVTAVSADVKEMRRWVAIATGGAFILIGTAFLVHRLYKLGWCECVRPCMNKTAKICDP